MKKILILLALSMLMLYSNGQSNHIAFDHLNVANGLPEGKVAGLCQDELGYLWIGTQAGLVRYNGYETKVYTFNDEKSAISDQNIITSVFQDAHHNLWVGSLDRGLFRYDRREDKFINFFSPSLNSKVQLDYANADSVGNIWSALTNSTDIIGIEKFDPGTNKFTRYDFSHKGKFHIPCDTINYFYINILGDVLVGSPKGEWVYDPSSQSFKAYPLHVDPAVHKAFKAALRLRSNHHIYWLWKNPGISRYDDRTKKVTQYKHDPLNINSIANDTITDI
jgi:streptogramin lyase